MLTINLRTLLISKGISTPYKWLVEIGISRKVAARLISHKTAFTIKTKEEFQLKRWKYKLNAPYINQLRQRYIAFFGRYGVPATPYSLRSYNLKQIEQ